MSQNIAIPLGKIGQHLGLTIHSATVHRWRRKGVIHNGANVKLRACKIGSRYFVYKNDLNDFVAVLNSPNEKVPNGTSFSKKKNEIDHILDEFGV